MVVIDQMTFGYVAGKLDHVMDVGDPLRGFKGTANMYDFDVMGNMTHDDTKDLDVSYNFLNLPFHFETSVGEMNIMYDATGIKWMKATTEGSNTETRYYIDGIEYVKQSNAAAVIEAIHHEVGRYVYNSATEGIYEYALRDHLGNTRVTFTDSDGEGTPEALQESHYYPFGMQMENTAFVQAIGVANLYMYSGKELNTDLGIEWSDFGARWYDAAVGRWWSVDPLAEKYVAHTGYNYVMGNPLKFVDPNGMEVVEDKADGGLGSMNADEKENIAREERHAGLLKSLRKKLDRSIRREKWNKALGIKKGERTRTYERSITLELYAVEAKRGSTLKPVASGYIELIEILHAGKDNKFNTLDDFRTLGSEVSLHLNPVSGPSSPFALALTGQVYSVSDEDDNTNTYYKVVVSAIATYATEYGELSVTVGDKSGVVGGSLMYGSQYPGLQTEMRGVFRYYPGSGILIYDKGNPLNSLGEELPLGQHKVQTKYFSPLNPPMPIIRD